MARLITKFKYLKPEDRKNVGGYAEYIATREGVEKIDESRKFAPAIDKQRRLIQKILADFPDSKSSLEYEDYLKDKTIGTVSEFITRALEGNADEMMHAKTYADYIATRPRAERIGSHGLFTDDGVAVNLQKVSDELNAHTGNVWTAIVSLRREVLAELIAKINGGTYDNPQVEDLLQALAKRLAVTNGKKQYGYLRKDIKEIINSIVDELGKDERIAALYDLWYESKETALKVYTESRPERRPLSQNKEFKSVKNMVIAEAMKLNLPTDEVEETDEPVEPDCEPTAEESESPDPPPSPMGEYERTVADADKGNKCAQYRAAKFMLDLDGEHYDPKKAIEYLTKSAKQGYTVAKYMLGKLYLKGEDVPKQMLHALHWLESAVQDDNQYAAQLIHSIRINGNWTAALASIRLLGHIARIIKSRIEDKRKGGGTDRKLLRKIEEKKQAQGLKQ